MNVKHVSAYLRKKRIYIRANSKTTTGIWIGDGPVTVIDEADPTVGSIILNCLCGSRPRVSHPSQSEWDAVQSPILEAAGTTVWSTFAKHAKLVTIRQVGEQIFMEPYSFQRKGAWFRPLAETQLTCTSEPSQIGTYLH